MRKKKGETIPNGMLVSTFIRLCHAMNARVIVEWRDPARLNNVRRWRIDNTDYYGAHDDGRVSVMDEEQKDRRHRTAADKYSPL